MKSIFVIEVYDIVKHSWVKIMHYNNKKVALFKYEQVKKCFPKLKYRMYEMKYWRLK